MGSGRRSKAGVLCVIFFFAKSKRRSSKHSGPVEIGTKSTYLHTHMPKINSSPVKVCKSSQKVLKKFSELGLRIFLDC
jgi:hypothetical protein